MAIIALQQGTIDVYFKMFSSKHAPQDMNQLKERDDKYIKAKKSMKNQILGPIMEKEEKRPKIRPRDKFQRAEKYEDSAPRKFEAKFTEYVRINAPRSQIAIDIKRDKYFQCTRPIKSNLEKRNQNMYCRYHKNVVHNIDDCIQFKNENEYLIR